MTKYHKLFDSNIIAIDSQGFLKVSKETDIRNTTFIKKFTVNKKLPTALMSNAFSQILALRNTALSLKEYKSIK